MIEFAVVPYETTVNSVVEIASGCSRLIATRGHGFPPGIAMTAPAPGRGRRPLPVSPTPMAIATTVHGMRACVRKKAELRNRPGPAPISSGKNDSRNRASPEPDKGNLLPMLFVVMNAGWCAT